MRKEILMNEPIKGSCEWCITDRHTINVTASGHTHIHTCMEYSIVSGASSDLLLISSETDSNQIVATYKEWENVEEIDGERTREEGIL